MGGYWKFSLLFILFMIKAIDALHLTLNTTNTWHSIGGYKSLQTEESALTQFLTFRSKAALRLENIKFKWLGKHLNQIAATLYKKNKEKDRPLAVDDNMVSDGRWNPSKQEFSFDLNEKLVAINKYYLVISYNKNLKKHLKQGTFKPSEQKVQLD